MWWPYRDLFVWHIWRRYFRSCPCPEAHAWGTTPVRLQEESCLPSPVNATGMHLRAGAFVARSMRLVTPPKDNWLKPDGHYLFAGRGPWTTAALADLCSSVLPT